MDSNAKAQVSRQSVVRESWIVSALPLSFLIALLIFVALRLHDLQPESIAAQEGRRNDATRAQAAPPQAMGASPEHYWAPVTGIAAGLQAAAAIVSAGLAFALWQVSNSQRQIMREQKLIAEIQNQIAAQQAKSGRRQNGIMETIERAYVSLSHDPPGIYQLPDDDTDPRSGDGPIGIVDGQRWCVSIEVSNPGHTPADVVSVSVEHRIGEQLEPASPDLTPIMTRARVATVAPQDHIFKWKLNDPLTSEEFKVVSDGTQTLWIIATATYVDRFGNGHRVGYGRRYIAKPLPGSKNNLILGAGTEWGYNYDVDVKVQK